MKKFTHQFGILFAAVLMVSSIKAQMGTGDITVGGTNDDYGYSVVQTKDGGYALGGYTGSYGSGWGDAYLVVLNSNGTLKWTKTIAASLGGKGYSLIQANDGGFALAGYYQPSLINGGHLFYMVKFDSTGALKWTKAFGDTIGDVAYSIIQSRDGGYVAAGTTGSFGAGGNDVYVVKLDGSGNLLWTRTVGGPGDDEGYSVVQSPDGGYLVTGSTGSYGAGGGSDVYIVKLDSTGTLKWTITAGGTGADTGRAIINTRDGGFAIAGTTGSYGAGQNDVYVLKFNSSNTLEWSKTIGGTFEDEGNSIVQSKTDGSYTIAGTTQSFGAGSTNMYLVKLDSTGALLWTKTVGGTNSNGGSSIIQTTDGGYAVGGSTSSQGNGMNDVWLVKFDANGNTCAAGSSGGTVSTGATIDSGGTAGSGGVVYTGGNVNTGGVDSIFCLAAGIEDISPDVANISIYPNPNQGNFTFYLTGLEGTTHIEIFNSLGEKVYSMPVSNASQEATVHLNLSTLPEGIYLCRVLSSDGNLEVDGKVVIQH